MRKLYVLPFLAVAFLHPACSPFGCSSDPNQMETQDLASLAVIAGASQADAHIQVQNRPGSIGAEQSFFINPGVDAAVTLDFNGRNVDQDVLFRLIETLDDTGTNGR